MGMRKFWIIGAFGLLRFCQLLRMLVYGEVVLGQNLALGAKLIPRKNFGQSYG